MYSMSQKENRHNLGKTNPQCSYYNVKSHDQRFHLKCWWEGVSVIFHHTIRPKVSISESSIPVVGPNILARVMERL